MPQAESTIVAGTGVQTGAAGGSGRLLLDECRPGGAAPRSGPDGCIQQQVRPAGRRRSRASSSRAATGAVPWALASSISGVSADSAVNMSFRGSHDHPDLPIWRYTVTASPGGATCTTEPGVAPRSLTCTVNGLTNGQPYTFRVTARNNTGDSAASAASASVTPLGLPGAPNTPSAVAGLVRTSVSWQPPTSDGGTPVTSFTATASPGGATCTTGGTTCNVRLVDQRAGLHLDCAGGNQCDRGRAGKRGDVARDPGTGATRAPR